MFASRMPSRFAVSDETLRSSSTPATVSHWLPTLIVRPIGFSVVKKRDFTPWPMIATGRLPLIVHVGERRTSARWRFITSKYDGSTPTSFPER